MNKIKDYYKKLNCTIDSSYKEIYLNFKTLSFPLHPENSNSQENDILFKEYCEAFYVLEYPEFRKIYNKIYKGHFLNKSIDLSEEEIRKNVNSWEEDGLASGEEYLKMTFRKFKRKVPNRHAWYYGFTFDAFNTLIGGG